uniref:Uncharacterized protein n=1 Tax=Anguilla anguilla TaxID=7936 RepID=A0A0E9VT29_ANGAN
MHIVYQQCGKLAHFMYSISVSGPTIIFQ